MRRSCFGLIVLLSIAMIAGNAFAQPPSSTMAEFTFQTQGLPEPTKALCRELFTASSAPFAKHEVTLLRTEYMVQGQWNEGDEIVKGSAAFEANVFPFAVKTLDEQEVPVDLVVLPEPRWVRRHCIPPIDFAEITAQMTEREKLLAFDEARLLKKLETGEHDDGDLRLDCIEFFEQINRWSRNNEFHSLPRGYSPWAWTRFPPMKSYYPFGLQEKLGRLHIYIHPVDFVDFPRTRHNSEFRSAHVISHGIVTSQVALDSNRCVRWVTKNDVRSNETSNWLAYGIVDANGAYSIDIPPTPEIYETGTFARLLIAPWVPTFKDFEHELPSIDECWSYPNLLLSPAVWPINIAINSPVETTYEEDWTLCEQYYSEHEVPVWCLYSDKDSTPFRETFYIKHFDEPCEHNLQKILIFSSVKPNDLVRVLARVHGMEDTAEEIYAEHEDELQAAYDAFCAEINKSLR